ncbi:MAG: hypothetical protein AB1348_01800 [Nitrospirota bacterium]
MGDYRKEADKFFPWEDEEGRKRKLQRGDSIPPKTSISSRLRSKPKIAGQEYLDIYIMTKLKDRAEKYGETLGKQQKKVSEEWRKIKKELLKQERELPKVPKGGIEESEKIDMETKREKKVPGHIKKLDWNY